MTRSRFALALAFLLANSSHAFVPQQARVMAPRVATMTHPTALFLKASITADDFSSSDEQPASSTSIFPCGDELDKRLLKIAIPMTITFLVTPLMGAIDLFWVNRMGNALAVAGQAASNQVYNTAFWLASFLPSVTATMVAKEFAKGDNDAVQNSVCQALMVGLLMAAVATPLLFLRPELGLASVLKNSAPAMQYAKPYLMIRAFAFLPGILSLVGFSAYRGTLDMVTPTKLVFLTNFINAVLDPIFIFSCKLGVSGAALATLVAECVAAMTYMVLLTKKGFVSLKKIFRLPSWKQLEPLVRGGFAMQLRLIAMNITFLAVARVTQGIDASGVAAAAHALALQTFTMGGVVLFALSTVAQAVIPADMVEKTNEETGETEGGIAAARATSNRIMSWGLIAGVLLGAAQIAALPMIFRATPMQNVRDVARTPAIVASVLQAINGLVFVGEGVMTGCQNFLQLAFSTVAATAGALWALQVFPARFGLTGVWMGFGVFNLIRLAGVCIHQFKTSPITPQKVREAQAQGSSA